MNSNLFKNKIQINSILCVEFYGGGGGGSGRATVVLSGGGESETVAAAARILIGNHLKRFWNCFWIESLRVMSIEINSFKDDSISDSGFAVIFSQ